MKGNGKENAGKGVTKKTYCTIGPFPLELVGEAAAQIENQGWMVRFVVFVGLLPVKIVTPGLPNAVPSYAVISCKAHNEGETMVPPTLKMPVAFQNNDGSGARPDAPPPASGG